MNNKMIKKLMILLWFIVSIVFIKIGINANSKLVLSIIIGQILVGTGIYTTFSSFIGWLIMDIGFVILTYPISKILGYDISVQNSIKYIVLIVSALIGLQLFFDDYLRNKSAKKRCTIPFQAKCISFEAGEHYTYNPVYKYCVDGKIAMYHGNEKSSVNPRLGEIITIFVNKKNCEDIYCPTPKAILMFRYLVGALLISFSTAIWLVL